MVPIMYNQAKCEDILAEIEKIENYWIKKLPFPAALACN